MVVRNPALYSPFGKGEGQAGAQSSPPECLFGVDAEVERHPAGQCGPHLRTFPIGVETQSGS